MGVLNDEHGAGPEPVDVDTEARGAWEDDTAEQYAWDSEELAADYRRSAGIRGWV